MTIPLLADYNFEVMMFGRSCLTILATDCSFDLKRKQIAQMLLEHVENITAAQSHLALQDIAAMADTNKEIVRTLLNSLQDEGGIRFERHRMIINRQTLQKLTD